jgi:hypothetical protein
VKVERVAFNNRKRVFEVVLEGTVYEFPYDICDLVPSAADPVVRVFVDPELAWQGFTYVLRSGAEDALMADHILWFNREPGFMRDHVLFLLSLEAQKAMAASRVSKNEIARRLKTSASQLARLLDQTNYSKSIDSMVMLLVALGCDVQFTATRREARANPVAPAAKEPASVA